jgi:hypothetical protein
MSYNGGNTGGGSGGGDSNGGPGSDNSGQGGSGDTGVPTVFSPPLSSLEIKARTHAILCTVGFLILLPLGVLLARYARTFTRR